MEIRVEPAGLGVIGELRDAYRREMACQIIHDSIHQRHGWTVEYAIWTDETLVGYGSVAVAGPWADDPAAYEFYLTPSARMDAFRLFGCFLRVAGVRAIEMQSNDVLGTAMLYAFAEGVFSESVLFEDGITTSWAPEGAIFRHPTAAEEPDVSADVRRWRAVVELGGVVAATGGVLFHYIRRTATSTWMSPKDTGGGGLGRFWYRNSSDSAIRADGSPERDVESTTLRRAARCRRRGLFPAATCCAA